MSVCVRLKPFKLRFWFIITDTLEYQLYVSSGSSGIGDTDMSAASLLSLYKIDHVCLKPFKLRFGSSVPILWNINLKLGKFVNN